MPSRGRAPASGWTIVVTSVLLSMVPFILFLGTPVVWRLLGRAAGFLFRKKTEGRRAVLVAAMDEENEKYRHKHAGSKSSSSGDEWEKVAGGGAADAVAEKLKDKTRDWDGIIGFFHPFCNAGGGGERVLWAAIRATQLRWPKAKCVVYTGDHEVTKADIIARVKRRFNIELHAPTVQFLYLSKRHWVLAARWPHFTLAGQSLGSLLLGLDAFSLLVPDVLIDTMGFAFVLGLSKLLFPRVPTAAYVHYPTISTDMLDALDPSSPLGARGVNGGQGHGLRGFAKKIYWQLFARVYCWFGGASVDVVMTNSTWTQAHVQSLWGPYRRAKDAKNPTTAVFPPVAVEELEAAVDVSAMSEATVRQDIILYIAQFRPEKDHRLIVQSYYEFLKLGGKSAETSKLVLVGSVRDDADAKRVYELRLMCNELGIKDRVEFHVDASWPEILEWLRKASIGVNGMWNEHFGIGVVEYQAAGLISVVHDSGGPKLDIVVPMDGLPSGFHATTSKEFAESYRRVFEISDKVPTRLRARKSAKRFTEAEFARKWIDQMERLIAMAR
ncbi:alpha-1,2-mannosyltransferase alg11 [Cordyceps militaris CM01]|uniref:GDP-Man:Man(3)GlcNAc(2)-PP-Dol alpha-1,2-mannosyltransferase n=1 Tax=Cordyceps militaris (strain CM01) TaxID=983644 RepID=G3J9X8_CORMM|nr:alpha-1,2-mannosyltransferase alg11 [Cordyceps militaris CM01]EGX94201.1 alpha-1,2-mannosyltransferase alg11 [Cordyceps militaris CM01]